jgi:hypothetical protein
MIEEEKAWEWGWSNEPEASRSCDMFHIVYDDACHGDDQDPLGTCKAHGVAPEHAP